MVANTAQLCECVTEFLYAPDGTNCSANCTEFTDTVVNLDNTSCISITNCSLISIDEAHCVSTCG